MCGASLSRRLCGTDFGSTEGDKRRMECREKRVPLRFNTPLPLGRPLALPALSRREALNSGYNNFLLSVNPQVIG